MDSLESAWELLLGDVYSHFPVVYFLSRSLTCSTLSRSTSCEPKTRRAVVLINTLNGAGNRARSYAPNLLISASYPADFICGSLIVYYISKIT